MTVLPVPTIPTFIEKYTGVKAPADLVVLAPRPVSRFGPEGVMGSANPPDKITPYSGIYDENGRLPTTPTSGMTFLARV
jgi:hypothetical protein